MLRVWHGYWSRYAERSFVGRTDRRAWRLQREIAQIVNRPGWEFSFENVKSVLINIRNDSRDVSVGKLSQDPGLRLDGSRRVDTRRDPGNSVVEASVRQAVQRAQALVCAVRSLT